MVFGLFQDHSQRDARGRSIVSPAVTARGISAVYPNMNELPPVNRYVGSEFVLAERRIYGRGAAITV